MYSNDHIRAVKIALDQDSKRYIRQINDRQFDTQFDSQISMQNSPMLNIEAFKANYLNDYVNQIIGAIKVNGIKGMLDKRYKLHFESEQFLYRADQADLPSIIDQHLVRRLCELIATDHKVTDYSKLTKLQQYYVLAIIELVGDHLYGCKATGAILAECINYNRKFFNCAVYTILNKINHPERIIDTIAEVLTNTLHAIPIKMTHEMEMLLSYIIMSVANDTFGRLLSGCKDVYFIIQVLDLYYKLSTIQYVNEFKRVANPKFQCGGIKYTQVSTIIYQIAELYDTYKIPKEAIEMFHAICRRPFYWNTCYYDLFKKLYGFSLSDRRMAQFLILKGPEDMLGQILHSRDILLKEIKTFANTNKTVLEHCIKVFIRRAILTSRVFDTTHDTNQLEMFKRYPREQDNLFHANQIIEFIVDFMPEINLFSS